MSRFDYPLSWKSSCNRPSRNTPNTCFKLQSRIFYKRAIALNPHHADALGNFAVLLHCSLREYGEADKQYQVALKADPFHANNHGARTADHMSMPAVVLMWHGS